MLCVLTTLQRVLNLAGLTKHNTTDSDKNNFVGCSGLNFGSINAKIKGCYIVDFFAII